MREDKDQTATALLARMAPELDPQDWVFATLPPDQSLPAGLDPLMICQEAEGLTLVVTPRQAASAGLEPHFPCRRITLTVPSDLAAVGFMAAITPELAAHGISCNIIAGFHHDHILVPQDRAQDAMAVLEALSRSNSIDGLSERP